MLRKSITLGEKAMQQYLRALRPFGAHFRREVPIGPYVVDFAWLSAGIVVEVDGASHRLSDREGRDAKRDDFLVSQGFHVIRVQDSDVIANSEGAFAQIEEQLRVRLKTPPPAASRQPPPRKGEGRSAAPVTSPPSPSPRTRGKLSQRPR
jgi:very-short-patch-repair endonuclease